MADAAFLHDGMFETEATGRLESVEDTMLM